jgi:hypothetical protein
MRTHEACKQCESAQSIASKANEKMPTAVTNATRRWGRIDCSAA